MPSFDTPTPITVVLTIPGGRVQLIADDRTDTTVDVLPTDPGKARDIKLAQQTTVEFADGVLHITATAKMRSQILGPSGSINVTIGLPAGSHLQAKAAGAEFQSVGRLGDVDIEGAYSTPSAAELEETAGLRLSAMAGDVTIGRLGGPAEISTTKGDIRIGEAVRGEVILRTQAGDVQVNAAAGVSASLDAGTSHGRVENALKNNSTVELAIHATTAHGDIVAHSL